MKLAIFLSNGLYFDFTSLVKGSYSDFKMYAFQAPTSYTYCIYSPQLSYSHLQPSIRRVRKQMSLQNNAKKSYLKAEILQLFLLRFFRKKFLEVHVIVMTLLAQCHLFLILYIETSCHQRPPVSIIYTFLRILPSFDGSKMPLGRDNLQPK